MQALLIAIIINSSFLFPQDNFENVFNKSYCKIIENEMSGFSAFDINKVKVDESVYDVVFYRCEWLIDPAVYFISGKVTPVFKSLKDGLDTIKLHLSDSLNVDSVVYHDTVRLFIHANNRVCISIKSINKNVMDSVSIFYSGKPPSTGFGSFIKSEHDSVPVIWTLSEPYGASDWWPCKNDLTDKADSIDIYIRTPSDYTAVSNGLLVSETSIGNEKIFKWQHRYPIAAYLICMAVTNYARYEHIVNYGTSGFPVVNYVYPEDSATASIKTQVVVPIMQLYDSLFGLYPFSKEKYGHAQFGWGGGMEHQTISFMGGFEHELIAHELAHHWFGDKITCSGWSDLWLNEGFATYLSGLTYERMYGGVWWMPFKEGRLKNITSKPDGSVKCNDTTNIQRLFSSRLTYNKGAMILHQLRWVIGDSAFFEGVRNYLNDSLLAYGFATTENLRLHFEQTYGNDLKWYFDDWYSGQGFPSYNLSWYQTGDSVFLTVSQSPSHPSVSFFELPLPIELKCGAFDTVIRVNNSLNGEKFSIYMPYSVDSVKLDPEKWIITNSSLNISVKEQGLVKKIKVYPNPANDLIILQIPAGGVCENVRITDMAGRDVISSFDCKSKGNEIAIPASNLSPGIYFLFVSSPDDTYALKFVVSR